MVAKRDFKRVDRYIWELPQDYREDMRVPAWLFSDSVLLDGAFDDQSADQLADTATLPGIVGQAMAMPDFHQGYGFPIGGVAATRREGGYISPGGVGYDINCGVRLLRSGLEQGQIAPHLQDLTAAIYAA